MLSFLDWIKLHKYPSKGLIETISIPNRYYYLMQLWHEIKAPAKYDYLADIGFDTGENHEVRLQNYLEDWINLCPSWNVNNCFVYEFDKVPPKEINYKYITCDALMYRYYCYCLTEQPLFSPNMVHSVPLCMYIGFNPINYNACSNPLNNAYRVCRFQDEYLSGLKFDYETNIEWNYWIKDVLSELSKQYS